MKKSHSSVVLLDLCIHTVCLRMPRWDKILTLISLTCDLFVLEPRQEDAAALSMQSFVMLSMVLYIDASEGEIISRKTMKHAA